MKIDLQVECVNTDLLKELFGAEMRDRDSTVPITDDASLHLKSAIGLSAVEFSGILEFCITFGSGVASGMVANWIWQKLQGRALSVTIDGVKIHIDEKSVKQMIKKRIEAAHDSSKSSEKDKSNDG